MGWDDGGDDGVAAPLFCWRVFMRSMTAVVLLVLLVLVAGCSSKKDDGPPPWSPTPLPSTSISSSTASPSMSEEELYIETERVFKRAMDIVNRYELYGDFSGFPAELNEVAMEDFLTSSHAMYNFMAEKRWATRQGSAPIITSEPLPSQMHADSAATLHVCTDTRPVPLYDQNGTVMSQGHLIESRFFFKNDTDGLLKIFYQQYREVESCNVYG